MDYAVLDELVLGGGLQGDEVHATLPAVVPARQPVHLLAGGPRIVPREEVALTVESLMNGSCNRNRDGMELAERANRAHPRKQ